jgi:hypothetical protein
MDTINRDTNELRANAKTVIEQIQSACPIRFGFDAASVEWLCGFIERQRLRQNNLPEPTEKFVAMLGAWLGECLLANTDGVWQWSAQYDDWCIYFAPNQLRSKEASAFPFAKIRKQFKHGVAGGDSILGFYQVVVDSLATGMFDKPKEAALDAARNALRVAPQAANPEMEAALGALRSSFKQQQQRLTERSFKAIRADNPSWMEDSDPLTEIGKQQWLLHSEGNIVWAALVQANKLLFKPGKDDCPALLVYSPDPHFDARPHELRAIASAIFTLKNTTPPDQETRRIAQMVSDEMDRGMTCDLPAALTDKAVRSAAFMVFRKHIPNGVLDVAMFPILTHPATAATMIVPFEFWPKQLIILWKQNKLFE